MVSLCGNANGLRNARLATVRMPPLRAPVTQVRRRKSLRAAAMLVCTLAVVGAAAAQFPEVVSATPAGAAAQRLCSGGPSDGQGCGGDGDCAGGACVNARGVCAGGSLDGKVCECNGGRCSSHPVCPTTRGKGTCVGGALAGGCCDVANDCGGGAAACVGTQRICLSGGSAGSSCLNDQHCPGGTCGSSGMVCRGGAAAGFPCTGDGDCPSGQCRMPVVNTPTPRPPSSLVCVDPNAPTPAAKRGQFRCSGKKKNGRECTTNMDCGHSVLCGGGRGLRRRSQRRVSVRVPGRRLRAEQMHVESNYGPLFRRNWPRSCFVLRSHSGVRWRAMCGHGAVLRRWTSAAATMLERQPLPRLGVHIHRAVL